MIVVDRFYQLFNAIFIIANLGTTVGAICGMVKQSSFSCNYEIRNFNIASITLAIFGSMLFIYQLVLRINSANLNRYPFYKAFKSLFPWVLFGVLIWGWVRYAYRDKDCEATILVDTALSFLIINTIHLVSPFLLLVIGFICCISCYACLIGVERYFPNIGNDGVEQEIIDSLYEYEYKPNGLAQAIINEQDEGQRVDDLNIEDNDRTCCICTSGYQEGEILRVLNCNHHMHKDCCDHWLLMNNSCPICRAVAIPQQPETV